MKRSLYILAALVFTASIGAAQSGWELDKVHSSVSFNVKHMVISNVTGSFKDFSITLNS